MASYSIAAKAYSYRPCVQIWYIVASHHRDAFLNSLPQNAKHAPGSKTFLPPQPSKADIAAGRITRIVQHPGELVITQPVSHIS